MLEIERGIFMIVQHNMQAAGAKRQFGINNKYKSSAMERLSSGYRINRAADDAAGLSISEEMRAQIRGLEKASLNVEYGMNLINVQDGAMQEIDNILNRQRELCVQAANDTNTTADRQMIQEEIDFLVKEIDNIANNTEYNTIHVLNGDTKKVTKMVMQTVTKKITQAVTKKITQTVTKEVGIDVGPVTEETRETLLLDIPTAGINGAMSGLSATNTKDNLKTTLLYLKGGASTSGYELTATDNNGNNYSISNKGSSLSGTINGITTQVKAVNTTIQNGVKTTYDFYASGSGTDVLFSVERTMVKKKNPTDSVADTYDISFKIENKTNNNLDFNIELGLDIETATTENNGSYIYRNDCPRFLDSSNKLLTTSNKYESDSIPDFIYMYDKKNPYLNIQAIYNGDGIAKKPSYVKLGRYGKVWGNNFISNTNIVDVDTMYSVGWNNISVGANSSSDNYNTMYGVSDPKNNSELKDLTPKKEIITTTEIVEITVQETVEQLIEQPVEKLIEQPIELVIQCGANTDQIVDLSIYDCKSSSLGLNEIPVLDTSSATQSISIIDGAKEIIASYRSHEGAMYNRLDHAYADDTLTAENLQSSESRIRDANMAEEMLSFSARQILEQAGTSILAQANSSPEGILSLLAR